MMMMTTMIVIMLADDDNDKGVMTMMMLIITDTNDIDDDDGDNVSFLPIFHRRNLPDPLPLHHHHLIEYHSLYYQTIDH